MRGVQTYGRPDRGVTGEHGADNRSAYTVVEIDGVKKTILGSDPEIPEGAKVLVRVG